MDRKINSLAPNSASKEIATNQGSLDLGIHQETEIAGVGMGVLSDGYHDPRPVRPVEYRERETPKITQQASDFDADY